MKLNKGDIAKPFSVKDIYNQNINLEDYKGKKVLISFFRNVACPFCNLRVHQLSKLVPELKEQGLEMIFFFETPTRHILRSTFHSGLSPVPIVGDPEKEIYKLYGVENSILKMLNTLLKSGFKSQLREAKELGLDKIEDENKVSKVIPADFLLNEDLTIAQAYYGTCINDHLPIAQIKQFAKQGMSSNLDA